MESLSPIDLDLAKRLRADKGFRRRFFRNRANELRRRQTVKASRCFEVGSQRALSPDLAEHSADAGVLRKRESWFSAVRTFAFVSAHGFPVAAAIPSASVL